MRYVRAGLMMAVCVAVAVAVFASSLAPLTLDEQVRSAHAVFRGTVLQVVSYRDPVDGLIYTRASLRVDEALKGRLPAVINVVHHGGAVDGIGQIDGLSPRFRTGEERLLFVTRRDRGHLSALQGYASAIRLHRRSQNSFAPGQDDLLDQVRARVQAGKDAGADVTDQAASLAPAVLLDAPSGNTGGSSTNGLLIDTFGVPWRHPTPDRGETIPYLVDTNPLPAGISPAQALTAVSNAFSAWAAGSSFKFVFAGTRNFQMAAANVSTNDGVFRIQLHDNYNYITDPDVLGIGGSYFVSPGLLATANWGSGGRVAGREFNLGRCGYVVLEHGSTSLQNLATFAEVLCHEIGHVLGLAHSSEDPVESSNVLRQAIMFYQAHQDGRGATLNSWDSNTVLLVHPPNTPPYSYERVMDVTTHGSGAPNVAGINEVQLRGFDLQSTTLSLAVTNVTSGSGDFSLAGSLLKFTPNDFWNAVRVDPAGNSYYDRIFARYSDGTNASAYIRVRVISMNPDSDSSGSDGLPDNWMSTYFGHTDPRSGDLSRAADDHDGDGLSNLNEYRAGMDPTTLNSAQRGAISATNTLQWQAKGYELYEVLGSTNAVTWARFGNPVVPTGSTGSISGFYDPTAPHRLFRILKVP